MRFPSDTAPWQAATDNVSAATALTANRRATVAALNELIGMPPAVRSFVAQASRGDKPCPIRGPWRGTSGRHLNRHLVVARYRSGFIDVPFHAAFRADIA